MSDETSGSNGKKQRASHARGPYLKNKEQETPVMTNDFYDVSDPVAFGNSIAQARIDAGLTQVELAVLSGSSPTLISNIENGTGNPTLRKVHQITKKLKVTLALKKN